MAKGRRPPNPALRGTLGTLLRTTLQQVGLVRDAVERQARSGRSRLDGALLQRKHRDTMTALGEAVYELAVAGELGDLEDFPEITACLVELEEIEAEIADAMERSHREAAGMPTRRRPMRRQRADDAEENTRQDNSFRVWRPTIPEDPLDDLGDDDDREPVSAAPVARKPQRKAARSSRAKRAARSGGGIAFVEDDPISTEDADLEEYMHDDDVPSGASEPDKAE